MRIAKDHLKLLLDYVPILKYSYIYDGADSCDYGDTINKNFIDLVSNISHYIDMEDALFTGITIVFHVDSRRGYLLRYTFHNHTIYRLNLTSPTLGTFSKNRDYMEGWYLVYKERLLTLLTLPY